MSNRPRPACRDPQCRNRKPCPRHPDVRYRGSSSAQGYGSAHRRIRAQVIRERGLLCEDCGRPPTATNPLDLDHVDGDRTNNDPANLRLRHHDEHSRKTALRDGRWGR